MQKNIESQKGFTLIEILLVMALIAALATIIIIAINPAEKFKQSRDAQRYTDVANIAGAVQQYYVDNKGVLPAGITTSDQDIQATGGIDLCTSLVPKYLLVMPVGPNGTAVATAPCGGYDSTYRIRKESSTSDRVVVSATGESTVNINVVR